MISARPVRSDHQSRIQHFAQEADTEIHLQTSNLCDQWGKFNWQVIFHVWSNSSAVHIIEQPRWSRMVVCSDTAVLACCGWQQ